MQDKNKDLSEYRFQNANETFEVANNCLKECHYRDAINRSYYAAFYAAKSVLALDEVDFKRHKDAVGYFNQHYVKDGPMSRDIGRKLGRLKQYREEGDYGDFNVVSEEEAKNQMEAAADIIREIKKYLAAKENAD